MNRSDKAFLYWGNDEFSLATAARELVNALVPESQRAFGLEIVDGNVKSVDEVVSAVTRCLDACQTQGFLTEGKVVWLREAVFLGELKICSSDSVKALLGKLAATLGEGGGGGNTLVITTSQLDRRSGLYKAFAEKHKVREFSVPDKAEQAKRQAVERAQTFLEQHGLEADLPVIEAFVERVGTDTRQIATEIEKVALYLGRRKAVQLQDIHAIVTVSASALGWDLTDAIGERRLAAAIVALRRLLFQRESPIGLLMAISRRVGDLALYREALDRGWIRPGGDGHRAPIAWAALPQPVERVLAEELEKDPRAVHPFYAGKLKEQARRFSAMEIKRNQVLIVTACEHLVSSSVPEATVLELLVVKMLRRE